MRKSDYLWIISLFVYTNSNHNAQVQTMSKEPFDVVFFGILQAGKDKQTVMQNMAALFKTDAEKLAPYFAGGRKVIKSKINADSAEKYKAALENVGLVINIESSQTTRGDETKESSQADTNETAANNGEDSNSLSLAPVGADVIENPVAAPAQQIEDISNISMAEVGADVIENPVNVAAQKIEDISNITLATPGSNVLEHPQQVVAQKIDDISTITLADADADILPKKK